MTSLRWVRPICTPGCLSGLKFVNMLELIGILTESDFPSVFEHILGFNVILMHYVFKLTGFRSKSRPKIRQYFDILHISNKNLFSISVQRNNYYFRLNYQY